MDYFFYNTDLRSLTGPPLPRFPILIRRNFAALGGDRKKYGEQFLQPDKGDTLLMYQEKPECRIVAIGRVSKPWDKKTHRKPWYYNTDEMGGLDGGPYEYRMSVDWFLDCAGTPITLANLRTRFWSPKFIPRGAIRRQKKHRDAIEAMIADMLPQDPVTQKAVDLSPAERVQETEYRILRDTAKAIRVKTLHQYQCQICGHTIELPNGNRYAEAHHIKPLGRPYDGPDVIENIICVCPNHHAELDYGVTHISSSTLRTVIGHTMGAQFIQYHNRVICVSESP